MYKHNDLTENKTKAAAVLGALLCIPMLLAGCGVSDAEPIDIEVIDTEPSAPDTITADTQMTRKVDTQAVRDTADTVFVTETNMQTDTDITIAVTEPVTTEPPETEPYVPPVTSAATRPVSVPDETTAADTGLPVTEPVDTTAPSVSYIPVPDHAKAAKEAYSAIVADAAAAVVASPIGSSLESFPYEKPDTRSALTDVQAAYYDEMYSYIQSLEPFVYRAADGHALDDVRAAADAILRAELDIQYYFRLGEIATNKDVTALEAVYFLPSDATVVTDSDKSALISEIDYFHAVCSYVIESMPEGLSVYDRYRYLASVITLTTNYDHHYENEHTNSTAYGAMVGGLTICRGYAYGFEYLCSLADLYCERVEGKNFVNSVHMWNVIKLDTGTYHVDVTWSDSGIDAPCSTRWMRYFAKTQEEILADHIISDGTVTTGT